MTCVYYPSGLALYEKEWAGHLSGGGKLKCDGCRNPTWWTNNDAPAYTCKICGKGFCEDCGGPHRCGDPGSCSAFNCTKHSSGLALWGKEYEGHLANGGDLKCDYCRNPTWWTNNDALAWVCKVCKKGFCSECYKTHS
jgi:hypothetical protein